jgi:NAD(P)-dependent dehydrogenase (short-subunit alcohol dehydrogenase family)
MTGEKRNKAALVTGGAQGIGRGIAELLSRRGYEVAIADVNAQAGRESGFLFIQCDVSKEPLVRACVRAAVKHLGRLDALVNNAGRQTIISNEMKRGRGEIPMTLRALRLLP